MGIRLGLLYHSELVPQAAALLFCSSRTVARATSLLLQEALGGVSAASAAGRLQECLDSSLLLCIHRAAVDVTAAECLSLGSDNSSSKLLHLQEEGAAPVAALLLSPFTPVDPAAVSAFVAFFTKRGSSRVRYCCYCCRYQLSCLRLLTLDPHHRRRLWQLC